MYRPRQRERFAAVALARRRWLRFSPASEKPPERQSRPVIGLLHRLIAVEPVLLQKTPRVMDEQGFQRKVG
jgi:hypothetical protein